MSVQFWSRLTSDAHIVHVSVVFMMGYFSSGCVLESNKLPTVERHVIRFQVVPNL